MIPKLDNIDDVQSHYLSFFERLKHSNFSGDISPDYANRTVLSTDNSVYQVLPQGVVYPKTLDDLVLLTQLANEECFHDIVLSPRGGGTGTNGQSLSDGIIVDLSKHLNQVLEINTEERWVRVQSGVVKDQLNAALKPHGLFFAPELSTSNRATIGGMINTDASGQGSCVYGKTRDHVLELTTVLMDGSVLHSKSLSEEEFESIVELQNRSALIHRLTNNIYNEHKENIAETFPTLNRCLTGYDLAHIRDENNQFNLNNILCGSEGTLGFISEAKLNVLPIPNETALIIVKYADFEASLRDASQLMQTEPTSIETIDSKVLNLAMNDFSWHQVEDFFQDKTPIPVKGINLVEYTGDTEQELEKQMSTLLKQFNSKKDNTRIGYAVAMGHNAVNKIWTMRKRAVGLLGNMEGEARPVAFVEDTAVPPEHLADFIMEFRAILDEHKLTYGMFGHVDAGVLHVRPALDMKDANQAALAWDISDQVAALTKKYHGLLWGEHGKGVRSEYAPEFFGELYPQLQRIKAAFDPYNQLNPGKIATPAKEIELLKIREVNTRGELDRKIPAVMWSQFDEAVYCNGNGACHNWNPDDAMCPSWKGTRLRTHTPKGRASLIREWLRLLSKSHFNTATAIKNKSLFVSLANLPNKIKNTLEARKGEYDFSHELYESMAACLACKSCTGQCPIKVDVPEFRSKFLALYHTRYLRPLKDYLVASLEFVLPKAAKIPHVYNGLTQFAPVKYLLRKWVGFVDGPRLSYLNLKHRDIAYANVSAIKGWDNDTRTKTVIIVQDAFTSYFETKLVLDTIDVLKLLGFNPLLAPFKANGKPLHVHGFLNAFEKTARKNAHALKAFSDLGIALVGIDPSMTLTYRAEYKKYLNDNELPNVELLQEWLATHTDTFTTRKPMQGKIFKLLAHCTEKTNAANSVKKWGEIFAALGHAIDVVELGCCGMAGTFGHEARNLNTSKNIYDQSWRKAINANENTDKLMATGYSCRSQVRREQQISIKHPMQVIKQILADDAS